MVRLNLVVTLECSQRLEVHCALSREPKNALIERLAMAYLLKYGKKGFGDLAESSAAEEAESSAAANSAPSALTPYEQAKLRLAREAKASG